MTTGKNAAGSLRERADRKGMMKKTNEEKATSFVLLVRKFVIIQLWILVIFMAAILLFMLYLYVFK